MIGREILGALDIIGAFVMIIANQRITVQAGFANKIAQWALLRRVAYLSVTFALFALGAKRADGATMYDPLEVAAQTILLIYVVIFPALRMAGWITQDMLSMDAPSQRNEQSR
jgi:uncharacterized membrane protein YhdT